MNHNADVDNIFNFTDPDLSENEFLTESNTVNNPALTNNNTAKRKGDSFYALSYFNNLEAIKRARIGDLPIECFLIKDKGIQALRDTGIFTLADLYRINDALEDAPNGIERIGLVKHKSIQEQYNHFISHRGRVSLKQFINEYLSVKQQNILDLRYGLTGVRHTLEEVGVLHGITRERVRQIDKNSLERLRRGIEYGLINTEVRNTLYHCARNFTLLRKIPPLPIDLNKDGIVYLYAAAMPSELTIYKNVHLIDVALIRTAERSYYDEVIADVCKYLSEQTNTVLISDILTRFRCGRSLVMSLANIIEIDGKVTLSTNKRASGVSKVHNIIALLRSVGGPMSINEIAATLSYEPGHVRNVVFYSSEIVNVGQSIYALKENGYLNLDTDGIMRHLLTQRGEPIPTIELINLVKEYRRVTDSAIYRILAERPDDFQQLEGGHIALRQWGYENEVVYTPRTYAVSPADAIMGVLEEAEVPMSPQEIVMTMEMMYGDETSLNITTLYAALRRLVDEGVIEKSGDARATLYELV